MSDPKIPNKVGPIKRVANKMGVSFGNAARHRILTQIRSKPLRVEKICDDLASFFPFSREDLAIKSGRQSRTAVNHSISQILHAAKREGLLLQKTPRGQYSISNRGKKIIDANPEFDPVKFKKFCSDLRMSKDSSPSKKTSRRGAVSARFSH